MKDTMRLLFAVLVGIGVAGPDATASDANAAVAYPEDYRAWQHVKSMIIQPGHPLENPFGGIHHVYANANAMRGLSSGRYESGAVFVFDLLEYKEVDRVIVEADRKRLDVMQYSRERFASTGGWGYTTFIGDSPTERVDQDVAAACHGCHTSAAASSYVFSTYRR